MENINLVDKSSTSVDASEELQPSTRSSTTAIGEEDVSSLLAEKKVLIKTSCRWTQPTFWEQTRPVQGNNSIPKRGIDTLLRGFTCHLRRVKQVIRSFHESIKIRKIQSLTSIECSGKGRFYPFLWTPTNFNRLHFSRKWCLPSPQWVSWSIEEND